MSAIFEYRKIAKGLFSEIQGIEVKNTPNLRRIRKRYSGKLANATAEQVLSLARYFIKKHGYRWIMFELITYHKEAIKAIDSAALREFGDELNSWGAVDVYAGYLVGPAWRNHQVADDLIRSWTQSEDRWWRRTALVSTVPLNKRSFGGEGDVPRTLEVCRRLAADKDDMVVKALSWALRELIPHDPDAVIAFLQEHDHVLASRVIREVNNKLTTGLKNPKPAARTG